MRITHLLSLAALSVAFVIPSDDVMSQVAIESDRTSESVLDKIPSKERLTEDIESTFASAIDHSKNAIDDALDYVSTSVEGVTEKLEEEYFDTKAWLEAEATSFGGDLEKPPHKGKRPHGPRHGHHGPHHKPNLTVFELISKSKYTTKLAELISEYDDLVDLLNGTTANFTVFAPTNRAFEKIPKHAPKPPKEFIKKLLTYHVSADFYPAGRVLSSGTIPTLLEGEYLSESPKDTPQRLSLHIGLRGLTVNYYSRVVAVNIFGTNGVIHGVDSFIIPPPKIAKTISFFPGEFSTLELGLVKTGLYDVVNDTSTHLGGTFFAPSNFAFKKLGPKINAFLFSRFGGKYLKALLKYHVVPCQTLYSDAYYTATGSQENVKDVPKGLFHVDLPTMLEDRSLSIDIARYGPFVEMRINGFRSVSVKDAPAKDGVLHVVGEVLIPPKRLGGELVEWKGGELTEEDLKERLEPFIEHDTESEDDGSNLEL